MNSELDLAEEISREPDEVEVAVRRAVRQAIAEHKRAGDPIVVCEDGEVRWIAAKDIVIPDEPNER